jgi:hypothetical protein
MIDCPVPSSSSILLDLRRLACHDHYLHSVQTEAIFSVLDPWELVYKTKKIPISRNFPGQITTDNLMCQFCRVNEKKY